MIERVHAAPGQGVSSMFRFGYAAGALAGIVTALGHTVSFTTPQHWQKITQTKPSPDAGRLRAAEVFPEAAHLFMRKLDHNKADAALIALSALLDTPSI
jgi:crossover junction endodeoxyribonuclease RuvC